MTTEKATIKCESVFSDDSQHRYSLSKVWDKSLPQANVITIAPSEDYNISSDLTTNIISNNMHLLGMGGFSLTNLISRIGIDVKKIKDTKNLWNKETDKFISDIAEKSDKIILAWGKFCSTHNAFAKREQEILELLKPYKDKVFQICDENGRNFLHPLTPAVRNGFLLNTANEIFG